MPSLLLAGVAPQWLETAASKGYDTGPRNQSAQMADEVKRLMGDLQSLHQISYKGQMLNPDDESSLNEFVTLLKSQQWDAISFGGGVRTIPQLGEYFTTLVNTAVAEHPKAKLLFPLTPKEALPQLKKYFPDVQ